MIIKVGNREIKVERCQTNRKMTTLQISRMRDDGTVISLEVVNMDKAETQALITVLKVEAPKD